mmetsp:Transcript_25157/g.78355  ORF Transcript_25157/g.78355 Transcript_25157/m.78355 type:complete len:257 (+) Transcript_25157:255-1025(+)
MPLFRPRSRKNGSVVLPKSTRVVQMMMRVALMSVAFCRHQEASSSMDRSSAMPPRRPACHMEHCCRTEMSLDLGSPMQTLIALESMAQEDVDKARPTRHRTKPYAANLTPLGELISAVEAPHRMKIMHSMSCAVTNRTSSVLSRPLASKCLAPYSLKMQPAQRLAMIPESLQASAAANMSHALATMYSVSGTVFPGSLIMRSIHTSTEARTIPNATEPKSRTAMYPRPLPTDKLSQLLFTVLNSTMATASLSTDSP